MKFLATILFNFPVAETRTLVDVPSFCLYECKPNCMCDHLNNVTMCKYEHCFDWCEDCCPYAYDHCVAGYLNMPKPTYDDM